MHGCNRIEPAASSRTDFPLLDQLYPMPDPLRSFEEWDQRHHRDIEGRAHSELVVERNRLRSRLRLDACPDPWLFERLSALEEGMRRAR